MTAFDVYERRWQHHRPVSDHCHKPSAEWMAVLRQMLDLKEHEGLGSVQCLFSEVTGEDRETRYKSALNVELCTDRPVCVEVLLGGRCGFDEKPVRDHECLPTFLDHAHLWTVDGKPAFITAQPYKLDSNQIVRLLEFCAAHGLRCGLSGWSWHAAGQSFLVEIWLPADHPSTFTTAGEQAAQVADRAWNRRRPG